MPVKDIIRVTRSEEYDMPKTLQNTRFREVAQWEARLWKPSPDSHQPAHFSITGQTKVPHKWDIEQGGMLHDLLFEFERRGLLRGKDKLLPGLTRWHLFDVKGGPMHYVANGSYHYKLHLRHLGVLPLSEYAHRNPRDNEGPKALDYFKNTIIFGALPDDVIPEIPPMPRPPPASDAYVYDANVATQRRKEWLARCENLVSNTLAPWLEGRLPRLMELFEADMVRWFGPDIVEP